MIPLHVLGAMDIDLTRMTSSEMMVWGLANLWKEDKGGGYAIKHGDQLVVDFGTTHSVNRDTTWAFSFDKSNFFEKAFLCLFPYSTGGIEADCKTLLDI